MPYSRFVALVLGVFLGVCFYGTASAASLEPSASECTVPCEKTFTYQPDPGQSVQLTWRVTEKPDVVTTCDEGPNQAGCQYTTSWSTLGQKDVCINPANSACETGARVFVKDPLDNDAPITLQGPRTLRSPGTVLYVLTPKKELLVSWSRSNPRLIGDADVRQVGRVDGQNKFAVRIYAPRGRIRLDLLAYTKGFQSWDRRNVSLAVRRYTGPTYGRFGIRWREYLTSSTYLAAPRLQFMSLKSVKWRLRIQLQRRLNGRWQAVKTFSSQGKDYGGSARYAQNNYGKALRVDGGSWKKARAAVCQNASYRVVSTGRITTPAGRLIKTIKLTKPLKKTLVC